MAAVLLTPLLLLLLGPSPKLTEAGLPEGWETLALRKVPRRTEYSWSASEKAVRAISVASASFLIRRMDHDLKRAPILRWRWKIDRPVPGGDESKKSGDDYAARVYVTFLYTPSRASAGMRLKYGLAKTLYGEYPPHAGINYIWANRLPRGESAPNAYTDRVRMIAVRSGAAEAGRWQAEERDVLADYRLLFGEDPPPATGVALMTDTDNTGSRAEAYFADVSLSDR